MPKSIHRRGAALLCAGLPLFFAAAGPAAAVELGPTVAVSPKTSPFADCKADDVASQSGTNYPGSEIEPFVEAAPKAPARLLAGWQQDRWSNGGARGLAAAYSFDGGASWKTVVPPGVSKCSGGAYLRASDPWVAISPNGTSYFMSLAFDADLPDGRFGANAMLVNRSTDGGRTWSKPVVLRRDGVGKALNDKNSITADPADSRYAYAVWDRLVDYSLPDGLTGGGGRGARQRAAFLRSISAGKAADAPARADEVFFEGPAFLARTTDGGKTWERARKVFDPGPNAQTINNLVEIGPGGKVHLFFTRIDSVGRVYIEVKTSTDHGATFPGAASMVSEVLSSPTYTITPNLEAPVRDAGILFDTAVDPATGTLAVVWQDGRFRGVEGIAFSTSFDGGKTWTFPIEVNRTPANFNRLREQAFVPAVEFVAGKVVVTYYDFRNDDASGELADAFTAICAAACYWPEGWTVGRRLTGKSFDLAKAPVARGYFLGDYMGLTAAAGKAVPLFGVTRATAGTADLVTRSITP